MLRHGQSEGNVGYPTTDPAKIKLTKIGELQVHVSALALHTMGIAPSLFLSSPYTRAKQGALRAKKLFPGTPIERRWPIQEFTYLQLSDRPTNNEERRPLRDAYWQDADPRRIVDPNSDLCESYEMVRPPCWPGGHCAQRTTWHKCPLRTRQFFNQLLFQRTPQGSPATVGGLACPSIQHMHDFYRFLHENRIPNGGIVRLDQVNHTSKLVFAPPTDKAELLAIIQNATNMHP